MGKKIKIDIHFVSGKYEELMVTEASLETISKWMEEGKVFILKDTGDTEFIINFGEVEKITVKGNVEEEDEDGE